MENILEIKNLSIDFKEFALKNINIKLEKGSIMGFIGQNGSGKTTTLKAILNMYKKSEGEIKVFGKDNVLDEVFVKNKIGYVPAECYLMPGKTIEDHKEAFMNFYEEFDIEIYKECLKKWKLKYHMTENELSTGMKTKAMLALTLPHKPELLILDEPTAGLDPVARMELLDELRRFVEDSERSVIIATHITSDLDKIADYVTLIHDGSVIESLGSDVLQEKYVILRGDVALADEYKDLFVGIKKWNESFEGLIEREKISGGLIELKGKTPNIEDILTFHIWGKR
ncbi:MAG: ABC transporter ATP-binding protein [Clostridium sp.]